MSAPFSARYSTILKWPLYAELCKGVSKSIKGEYHCFQNSHLLHDSTRILQRLNDQIERNNEEE